MTLSPVAQLKALSLSHRAKIAMSEGAEPRTVEAAIAAVTQEIADVILVGDTSEILAELAKHNAAPSEHLTIEDPASSALTETVADAFYNLRKHKGISKEAAETQAQNPLTFAATLVHLGHADGTVGGAVNATADIIRQALQVIGKAEDADLVSSFFLMLPPENAGDGQRAMIYADCGFVVEPDAQQLAAIAASATHSARTFLSEDPIVAMLSFSTKGSARHPNVTKVADAAELFKTRQPDVPVDGDLQFDAAFVPSTAARKAPNSTAAGRANVMIFPTLDAGNISYKITQRIGGYTAIGPVLQGLAKPANDLSRGCSVQDIVEIIAVTVLQAEQAAT